MSTPKLVPGLNAPSYQVGPRVNYGALQRAGLPLAPYIQHGGARVSDIMVYGRDPYRGLGSLTATLCSGDAAVREATEQVRSDARDLMKGTQWAAVGAAALGGAVGSFVKGPIVGALAAGGIAFLLYRAHSGTYNFG